MPTWEELSPSNPQVLSWDSLSDTPPKPESSGEAFKRGAIESFKQLPQLGYGVLAGAGAVAENVVGDGGLATGVKNFAVKKYQEKSDDMAKNAKPNDEFSTAYDKAKEGDIGALGDWLAHGLGYVGGQAVQMVGTAGVGSLAGKVAAKGIAENLASSLVSKEAAAIAASEAGAKLSIEAVNRMAVSKVAGQIGEQAALAGSAFGMEGGEIFGDLVQKATKEGRQLTGEDLFRAGVGTTVAGLLEYGEKLTGLSAMKGKMPLGGTLAEATGFGGRVARSVAGAAMAAPMEYGQEFGQTLAEEYGKGADPFSEASFKQAKNAAALGALGGSAHGVIGGAFTGALPKTPQQAVADIATAPDVDAAIAAASEAVNAGPKFDRIDFLVSLNEIKSKIKENSILQKLRDAGDAGTITTGDFLNALSVANNPVVRMDQRELARDQVSQIIEQLSSGTGFTMPGAQAEPAPVTSTALATQQGGELSAPIQGMQFDPNTIDGQTRFVDELPGQRAIGGPRALTGPNDAAPIAPTPGQLTANTRRQDPRLIPMSRREQSYQPPQLPNVQNATPGTPAQAQAAPVEAPKDAGVAAVAQAVPAAPGSAPVEAAGVADANPVPNNKPSEPAHYGTGHRLLTEGGKPFKTKRAADDAKKLQPMMRVKKVKGGYVLTEKTPAQIAAQARAAARLAAGSTGDAGMPQHAHGFMAREGGLSKETMSDLGLDRNQRIGSMWLFKANGGMTLEQATEKLVEGGYLKEGASHSDAINLIKKSITTPQYTADGWERIAQAEADARFEDHLAAQEESAQNEDFDPFASSLDEGFDLSDIDGVGYDEASDPIKLEVNALLAQAESLGIDTESIRENEYENTKNGSEQDYFEAFKRALASAIEAGNRDSSPDSGEQGNAAGENPNVRSGVESPGEAVAQSSGKSLEAGQKDIDLAKSLTYKLPYLEQRLVEGLDPTDGFDMHILANSLPESIAYNRMMMAHNGDFQGIEFKKEDSERYAFVLPDASNPGSWRVSYFDKNGFSRHESEPTREKAQQTLAIDGFTVEDKGALDRFAETKEWAIGTAFGDLIMQLNKGMITHAQFLDLQQKLNNGVDAQKQDSAEDFLVSPSREDILARQQAEQDAAKAKEKADKEQEEKDRADRIQKEIDARQRASAENFIIGQNAEDALAGQGDVFNQPEQPAAVQQSDDFVYNGVRIYKAKIKFGEKVEDRWAVESADNKQRRESGDRNRGGDSLFATIDEAKADADRQIKRDAQKEESAAQMEQDKRDQDELKKALESDNYNGFLDGLPENRKALVRKALSKELNFQDGGVMTIRARIEKLFSAGNLEPSTDQIPVIQPMSRAAFNRATQREQDAHEKKMREAGTKTEYLVNGSLLGKTGYDYAQHLLSQKQEPAAKATAILDAAEVKGKERIDVLKDVKSGTITPEEVQAAYPAKEAAKIEDIGEKIGGAKKDVWTGFKDKLNEVSDDEIASKKLSEVWPAPDYQALIDGGMNKEAVAMIRTMRDEIPAKPRSSWKVNRWAEQVKMLRTFANKILNGDITPERVKQEVEKYGDRMKAMFGRAELYMEFGHSKSLEGIHFGNHFYNLYRGQKNVNLWVIEQDAAATAFSNFPRELATGATKQDAIDAFKARYSELDSLTAVKKASFDIVLKDGKYWVAKKIGRNHADMAGPFATVKEARDYRANNLPELEAKLEKYKQIPRERRDVNDPRVGEDMRNGQDVTPEFFAQTFGFRGVEFGNWVEQKRRQKDLNDAFDGLMDMAAVLGIPARAISLNGQLGLAFGARGSGGVNPAAAHYESDKVVINLTKKEGAGSLGHEWWHAVDNYFSKMRGKNDYMTVALDVSLASRGSDYFPSPGVRKEMIDAFGSVVKSIRNTSIKMRSQNLDDKRGKAYWTTGEEMTARAFESYLIAKLQDQDASNDYLANVVDQKVWDAMAALGVENENSYPYPTADEIPAIRAGFDKFFDTVQTKEDEFGNVAMYSRGENADVANAWTSLASNEKAFSYPSSDAKTMDGIADDMGNPLHLIDEPGSVGDDVAHAWRAYPKDIDGNPELEKNAFVIQYKDGKIELNVDKFNEGDAGSFLYALVGAYAHNNGLKFEGDRYGITEAGMERRLENMISLALKYGSSDFIAPHEKQLAYLGMKWKTGDNAFNLEQMLIASYRLAAKKLPQIKDYIYDFDTGTTTHIVGGVELDDAGRTRLRKSAREAGLRAGERTIARAVFTNTILNETTPEGRRRLLERINSWARGTLDKTYVGSLYSRNGDAQDTAAISQVQNWVNQLSAKWKNGPEIQVVSSIDDLPVPAASDTRGLYYRGTVYLVASRIGSKKAAGEVLAHESIAHYGLREMLGESDWYKFMRQMQTAIKSGNKPLNAIRDQIRSVYVDENGKPNLTEIQEADEIAAKSVEMAIDPKTGEFNPGFGFLKSVFAKVAQFLRDVGFDVKFTNLELQGALVNAMRNLEVGNRTHGGAVSPAVAAREDAKAARNDQTQTPEFKRWFGDSVVTDNGKPMSEGGKPLVVYHGTKKSFNTFKGSFLYFFTTNPEHAKTFGGKVMPVYLSIQNPAYSLNEFDNQDFSDMEFDGIDMTYPFKLGGDGKTMFENERQFVVMDSNQIKSATKNNGNFDPSNPDIRYARGEPTAPDSFGAPMAARSPIQSNTWNSPSTSKFDNIVYTLQNKQIDTKRVVEAIKQAGKDVAESVDVYLREELFHGRSAKRTEDFLNNELTPLLTDMKARGISLEQIDKYLHARHAEEANKVIASRNPDMPDGGSGMNTQEAKDYLNSLGAAERNRLDAVAKKIDGMIATTRQLYADEGLESQETVDSWGAMFKHYVPLMREEKDGGMGIGQGFSIKGKESKGRVGSSRAVVDILANIAMQREKVIVRGEKNRVATALVGLATENPNPDFWTVGETPHEKVYDPKTNSVVDRIDPMYKSRENVVVAKVKQPDGNINEVAVVFNEDNDRAVRMAASLKNLDALQLNGLLGISAKISRYISSINTQYNPIFGIVNLARDVQGAMVNLSTTELKGQQKEVSKHVLSALKGVYLDARAVREGKTASSKWAALNEEFQNLGGQTGYRDLFATSEDRAKALQNELMPYAWMDGTLGKIFTANGSLKAPMSVAQDKAKGLFDWLSDYNLAMENAVRLSAFKVGLDQGMTKERAASLAKNLTVNFNRKGQISQQAGALYAFFNAGVQGTARLSQVLFEMDGSDHRTIRLSATGKKVVAGGIMLGVAQAVMLAAAGFGDDDPPEFVRERNLIIPTGWTGATGDKAYITIPMPLGLHVLPNIGRVSTEFALGGFRDPVKRAAKLFGLFTDAFNPMGGGASLLQILSPTPIDPLVALAENKDGMGRTIAKTSRNPAVPGFTLAKDTASKPAKMIAEAINYLSGGTEYKAGVLSPTPDQVDFLIGQATGGVGREISKGLQTASAVYTGEELPTHKIPLVGRFYGDSDLQSAQSNAFYSAVQRIEAHELEIKGLRKDGKSAELTEYMAENPEARLIPMANRVELQIQNLQKRKRELMKNDADAAQIKAVENQITERMKVFNMVVRNLREKQPA